MQAERRSMLSKEAAEARHSARISDEDDFSDASEGDRLTTSISLMRLPSKDKES